MFKFAALTKIAFALALSLCALLTARVESLSWFVAAQIAVGLFVRDRGASARMGGALALFAAVLYGIQLLFGASQAASLVAALRMWIMAFSVCLLLRTTRTQEITAALVKQCRMPYSYAFMVTAVLRFAPDLLAESRAVREAQACRGYRPSGNPLKRMASYMTVIKPMVFRSIQRSEDMALSLEMRGFMRKGKRTFLSETKLRGGDYLALLVFLLALASMVAAG